MTARLEEERGSSLLAESLLACILECGSAHTAARCRAISRSWRAAGTLSLDAMHGAIVEPVAAAALVSTDQEDRPCAKTMDAALRQLLRGNAWLPQAVVVCFCRGNSWASSEHSEEEGEEKKKNSFSSARAMLPPGVSIVGCAGDGVIGVDRDGRPREYFSEAPHDDDDDDDEHNSTGASILLIRGAASAPPPRLFALPRKRKNQALRWDGKDDFYSHLDADPGSRSRHWDRYFCKAVSTWFGSMPCLEEGAEALHLVLAADQHKADIAAESINRVARSQLCPANVMGGLVAGSGDLFAGFSPGTDKGSSVCDEEKLFTKAASWLVLSFFSKPRSDAEGTSSSSSSGVGVLCIDDDEGAGEAKYDAKLKKRLRKCGVAAEALDGASPSGESEGEITPQQPPLAPRFGFASTCCERGPNFHGTENAEANVHAKVLPGVPIVGFFAGGEIGPGRHVDEEGDLVDTASEGEDEAVTAARGKIRDQYCDFYGYTTVLGFLG